MKIVVSKSVIEKAVKNLCRVINTKNALPILGDIMCKVDDVTKEMQMVSSDSEIWLISTISLTEAEGSGAFCVNASRLNDALKQLAEQPLTIIADTENGEGAHFELQHEDGKVYFPIEDANEYPSAMQIADSIMVDMPAKYVAAGINATLWAAATDSLRPIMENVCFNFTKQYADIVASDGHVVMRYRLDDNYGVVSSMLMPKKVANMLPKMLEYNDADDGVTLMWNEHTGCVEQEDWSLVFRLQEGRYVNYDSVIPESSKHKCTIDRDSLIRNIKKVQPFNNENSDLICCQFNDSQLDISGDDFDLSIGAQVHMPIDAAEPFALSIGFKATSMVKLLTKMSCFNIDMLLNDMQSAVIIRSSDQDAGPSSLLGLTMPMLIND